MSGLRRSQGRFRTMHTLIVGSGMAGVTIAEGLLDADAGSPVTIVTGETEGIYTRPLLSHGFAKSAVKDRILVKTFAALREKGITVKSETQATSIDRVRHRLNIRDVNSDSTTEAYLSYDRLILAPGSEAFIPPALIPFQSKLHILNGLKDLRVLQVLRERLIASGKKPKIAVLGGGLIGCEVASDLALAGDRVSLFHNGDRLLERVLDLEASSKLLDHFQSMQITVYLQVKTTGIEGVADLRISSEKESYGNFDAVLIATGFSPRIDLAKNCGLAVGRGIAVDGYFRTEDPLIFALGDAAEVEGKLYPFIVPIRSQAQYLVRLLTQKETTPWNPPAFKPVAKIHGFKI